MAIIREEAYLAYAKVIEFLSVIYSTYLCTSKVIGVTFSRRTAQCAVAIEEASK